jgi:diguanylate cyclase (GGDEF)-like protein/PAS domain S-box-containing protein
MLRISPVVRISLGLVLLTVCILLTGDMLGLTPGRTQAVLDARKKFCETIAIQFALAAQKNDLKTIRTSLEVIVERNEDVMSAALRNVDGRILAEAGNHEGQWQLAAGENSSPTHAQVPIYRGSERWGTVEVRFTPVSAGGLEGFLASPLVRLLGFTALAGFISFLFFMRRTLRHLDPSAVVPGRVKAALDVLAEGVVLLDEKERIVLANAAFCAKVEQGPEALLGRTLSALGWLEPHYGGEPRVLPWLRAMSHGETQTGTALGYASRKEGNLTFMVSGAPILDGEGELRGALATFDDVTELEVTNRQLRDTVHNLKESRDKVAKQADELQFLASRDPLTGLLNRRSFFDRAVSAFEDAAREGKQISCIMADIDFFKKINDNFGHSVGDQTIQMFSRVLQSTLRGSDLICRYGGEEFVVLLQGNDLDQAADAAERVRYAVENCDGLTASMTGSFGVSSLALEPSDLADLIEQADRALYRSKESGRNKVTRFDETPEYGDL